MMGQSLQHKIGPPVFAILVTLALVVPAAAQSSGNIGNTLGNIFGAIINQAIIDNARKSWSQVDQTLQACLISAFRISPENLAEHGIGADDSRVTPYIQACQQAIAQANERQEQVEQAQQAQQQAEAEAQEQQHEAEAKAQEQARQAQLKAEAEAKAEADAKRQKLVAKYGSSDADAILAGIVRKGMNADEVEAARGTPDTRQKIPPNYELWTYGSNRISFLNGKVTAIGQ